MNIMTTRKRLLSNKIKGVLLGTFGLSALSIGSAHADLLEYSFTDTSGEERTLVPSAKYANPVSDITFALSGGVDRRVRITIFDENEEPVSSGVSELLGAGDRISVSGKEYYGAFLELMTPGEGIYTLRSEIVSADGEVVRSDDHQVMFDATPPQIQNLNMSDIISNQRTGVTGDGIADDASGVDRAVFYTIDTEGVRREIPASYNDDTGIATVIINQVTNVAMTPVDETDYRMGFGVYDRAGNYSENQRVITVDKSTPKFEPLEVYNPVKDSWEPYVDGMLVHENPVMIRVVRLKKDHIDFNGSKLGWRDGYNNEDETRIFSEMYRAFPNGSYGVFYTTAGYASHTFHPYKFTYAPNVGEAPKPIGIHYKLVGADWVPSGTLRRSHPYTIEKVRILFQERPYPQIAQVNIAGLKTCFAPPGETSCEIDVGHSITEGRSYSPYSYSVRSEDGKLTGGGGHLLTYYDFNAPQVTGIKVDLERGIVSANVFDGDRVATNYRTYWQTTKFELIATSSEGVSHRINRSMVEETDFQNYYAEFPIKKLPSGEYTFTVEATDTYDHVGTLTLDNPVVIDNTKPSLQILTPGGTTLSSLDEIGIRLRDDADPEPTLTSILLEGGPAREKVQLSWRRAGENTFSLEYPIMFPSLSEGEGYTLTVVAEDAQGNQATETASFTYNPPLVSVAGHPDGNINIPAVSYAFNRNDGTVVMVSEPLGLAGGQTLAGVYDLLVTLSSDTVNPINANGVIVQPGETATVMGHDFSAHGGRISLAVSPVGNSIEEGISRVLVSTTAPNAPMVQATLHQWMPDVAISLNSQTPVQAITDTTISAAMRGDQCALTTSVDAAKAGDPILAPVCLLEWDSLPKGFSAKEVAGSELPMTNLVGRPLTTGVNTVGYSIYLFNKGSEKVLITQQEHSFDVRPASEAIKLELVPGDDDVYQGIQDLTYVIRSSSGTLACDITGNETIAINAGKQWSDRPTCLVRWTRIPYGMSDDGSRHNPQLRGYMTHLGEEIIGWKASLFTPAGEEVVIYDVSSPLNVLAPPPIEVDLPDQPNRLNANTYAVSSQGGFVGNTTIRAVASDIKIRAMLDTQIVRNDEVMGYGQALQVQNPINANAATLWSVTPYTLETSYTRMANLATKTDISLLAVPADSIQPVLMYSEYDAIDTEEYQVSVRISDIYQRNEAYSITKHGDWDIRLLQSMDDGSLEPITDWEPVNGEGVMTAAVDISDMTNQQMIIYAEARVRSPVPEYSSIRRSTGSLSLFVLSGSPLDAEISTVKLQGLAPLRASFIAKTVEHWANRSMGDVTWEISSDNGATWEEQEPGRLPQRLSHVFQAGNYLVRAHIQNRHSGAMSVTPTVEVSAFEVPKARMSGPTNVFVGDEGVYTITDPEGEPFNPDGYVIEWTEDRGNTWQQGGPVYSLTRETPERIQLQARIRYETAPEHRQAYRNVRSAVSFRNIRPPRVQIIGPRRSEVGVEATWTANLRLPYPGMSHEIQGFFTLPDGQRVDAHEVLYTPTQEDFAREKSTLLFESWIDGYQDKGAHSITEYRLTFWSYDWPDWQFNVRANAIYAPADITVNLRNLGLFKRFEELKVEWDLPQSDALEVTRDNSDMSRSFTISEPGVYTVAAHVSDARGHYSFVEVDIELLEPEAWGVDLTWTGDNQYNRAPLKVLVRPTYYGGHPRDRINSKQYVINGEVVSESGDYGRAVLGAGTHEVIMNLGTMMGRTVQGRTQVTVEKNRPPVCEISVQEGRTNWRADASCSDEDGRMSTYKWWVNGELQSISSRSISIAQWRYPEGEPIITLVGVDDSGDESAPVSQK